jgi:hypothetical protein
VARAVEMLIGHARTVGPRAAAAGRSAVGCG